MFVETYDANGNSSGFDLYEVGSVRNENGTWVGVGADGNAIKDTEVLSHDSLDESMGNAYTKKFTVHLKLKLSWKDCISIY